VTAHAPAQKFTSGTGAPSNGVGASGDWYLDSAAGSWYLKVGAAWAVKVNGGSLASVGDVTFTSDSDGSGTGDIVFSTGAVEHARFTAGGELRVGNATDWSIFAGTGTPPGVVIPVKFIQHIGVAGTPVVQTTQGLTFWTWYRERTLDDSAESGNIGVVLNDAWGGFSSPQTKPVVAWEGDALIQGGVVVNEKVIGIVGGVKIQNTAHADTAIAFYAAQTVVDAGASATTSVGFYDEGVSGTRPTNVRSLYGKESLQTEKSLYVGVAGYPVSNLGVAMITGHNVSGGESDIPSLVVRPGAGQTAPTLRIDTNGGLPRFQVFGATGNIQMGNGATSGSGVGITSMVTTTAPTGTPITNGFFSYCDPADGKAKVKTNDAQVTTIQHALDDILRKGLGYQTWAFDPNLTSGGTAPTAGTVYLRSMPVRAGQVLTNTAWLPSTAATGGVGTAHIFTGYCDTAGVMLAQSADDVANAGWAQSAAEVVSSLSGSYTVLADGIVYAVFLQTGAWGSAQLALAKQVSGQAAAGVGVKVYAAGVTTGQTALPANGAGIAGGLTVTGGVNYFAGAKA